MNYVSKKGFMDPDAPKGYQKRGLPWSGGERRAKDLLLLGLIAEDVGGQKLAPAHQNKMAPEPSNKVDNAADPGGAVSPPALPLGPAVDAGEGAATADEASARVAAAGAAFVDRNAADVLEALGDFRDAAVLETALAAEQAKGDKSRKTVLEALAAALAPPQA
jgi:hypothetical protein